ncbi:acyl-CoA dehydrogenase family protein [Lichenicoccus sp.]|uniref:acyl-CoA dehydrogenase family protein n=1 Tax=Lichenicoccus sp. TaxID=2781899 RepID=UPI003D0D9DB6
MVPVSIAARFERRERTADEMVEMIDGALPRLQANALGEEKAGRLCDDTIKTLDEIGVFRMSSPREYGGLAFSTEEQGRVYTSVGKIAGSTGWVSWVTTTHGRWIAMFSKKAQDEVYGMDWMGPRISGVLAPHGPGQARRVDGGFMLSGRWPFCSGCRHTAWSILGSMCQMPDGQSDMIMPLVCTADVEILDDWAVSGMKGTGSNTVQIKEELFVPNYRVLRMKDANAGRWASTPPVGQVLFLNNFIDYTTITSGSTPLGMAKGALDYYRERLEKRGIIGTDYKVQADAPVAHLQLAEAISRIDAAERLLSADCNELDRRAAAGEPSDDLFQTKIKFDVSSSVRGCCEAIEILHRGSGASTIHEANPMQRYARDIRVATVHGHLNYETCAENYGRALAGKPLFGSFSNLEKQIPVG